MGSFMWDSAETISGTPNGLASYESKGAGHVPDVNIGKFTAAVTANLGQGIERGGR